MKAVLLAGGKGTRIQEESSSRPKPMIEIGGRPILWHIMKIYSHFGINNFIVCLGYRGYLIKEYFTNYFLHNSDVTIDLSKNSIDIHQNKSEPWKITLIDTGLETMTGGRLKRVKDYLGNEDFCMTYGDGVGNIDIEKLLAHHKESKALATVTAVTPPGRFGALKVSGDRVVKFEEKPVGDGGKINGGFFVLNPKVIDLIKDDYTVWEKEPLETLAAQNNLSFYKHEGFWQPMDTLRDKMILENLWEKGETPWKKW